jgi:hypothetical protein
MHFTLNKVNIKALWFDNRQEATELKNMLDSGMDFDQAFEEFPKANKTNKDVKVSREGIFFEELWRAQPNEIIGPTKGFLEEELKWRIVKIIKKIPGEKQDFESTRGLSLKIKNYLKREEREKIKEQTTEELLKKYSYKIYRENYEGLDFYDIP